MLLVHPLRIALAAGLLLASGFAQATTAAQCNGQKGKARDACYQQLVTEKCGALTSNSPPTPAQMQCRGQQLQALFGQSGIEQRLEAVQACKAKAKKRSQAARCEKLLDE